MWWPITSRVIASVVTFLIGWAVFAIARPTEELRLPENAHQIKSITVSRGRCFVAGQKCNTLIATFRSDGTCNYVTYAHDDHVSTFTGDFKPQDLTYLIEEINKQGSFELPLISPAGAVTEATRIEAVSSEGTRFVATYNWATAPLDYPRCNLY